MGDGVLVDLQGGRAVLQGVGLAVHGGGQLAGLAHRHEAHAERVGDHRAEDEAPRLDAGHDVDLAATALHGVLHDPVTQ